MNTKYTIIGKGVEETQKVDMSKFKEKILETDFDIKSIVRKAG